MPKAPKPLLKLGPKPKPTKEVPLGPAPAGRPPTNLGKYLIKPANDTLSGFEMLNDTPDTIEQVQEKYLKLQQLPPGLQPGWLRLPAPLEKNRANNISRGMNKPRSRLKPFSGGVA